MAVKKTPELCFSINTLVRNTEKRKQKKPAGFHLMKGSKTNKFPNAKGQNSQSPRTCSPVAHTGWSRVGAGRGIQHCCESELSVMVLSEPACFLRLLLTLLLICLAVSVRKMEELGSLALILV